MQTDPLVLYIKSDEKKTFIKSNSAYWLWYVFEYSKCMFFVALLGGTVDITVHEVQSDNGLKEVYRANGGSWGGTYIDQAFK